MKLTVLPKSRRLLSVPGEARLKLKVGVVGLGPAWHSRHWPALNALNSRFEVRAVCDPVARRAEQVAIDLGARSVDGFRALTAAQDIEAILMLSGRWFGALPILAACDQGKAVYCSASVDMPRSEVTQLRDRVRRSGVAFMAELPFRLAPATIRLKQIIESRLGKPKLIFCNESHVANAMNMSETSAQISLTRRLMEMVDWCRFIVGDEPISVQCATHSPTSSSSPEDYSLVTLEFESQDLKQNASRPLAQIACGGYVPSEWSDAASFRRPADLQVVCENGMAFLDLPGSLVWFDSGGQHTESLDQERPLGEQLLMDFHRSVSSLVLRTDSFEDSIRALQVVLAAKESADTGKRVACC